MNAPTYNFEFRCALCRHTKAHSEGQHAHELRRAAKEQDRRRRDYTHRYAALAGVAPGVGR